MVLLSIAFGSTFLGCEYAPDHKAGSACAPISIYDAEFVVRGVLGSRSRLADIPGSDTTAVSDDLDELRRVQHLSVVRLKVLESIHGPKGLTEVLIIYSPNTGVSLTEGEEVVFFLKKSLAYPSWNGLTVWSLVTYDWSSQLRHQWSESTRSCGGIATQTNAQRPVYGLKPLGDEPSDCHSESESCLATYDVVTSAELVALGQSADDTNAPSCLAMHWEKVLDTLRKRYATSPPTDSRVTP